MVSATSRAELLRKLVECPSDVDVETGKTFDCEVTAANGDRSTARLKILNDDADVAFVGYKKSK